MSTPVKFSFAYSELSSPTSPTSEIISCAEWMTPLSKKSTVASKMTSPAAEMSSPTSKKSTATSKKTSPAAEMSSPASKISVTKTRSASMDSKCTTFSDIIRALDETHDRIASMGVDEMKQDRIASMHSLLDDGQPKNPARRAFDQKKYLADWKNGDITLREIQIAANATKTPEQHREDWIRVNGKLPEPKCGYGKCTYEPYPAPAKRRRDAISDNIEDAVKKVKNVFK